MLLNHFIHTHFPTKSSSTFCSISLRRLCQVSTWHDLGLVYSQDLTVVRTLQTNYSKAYTKLKEHFLLQFFLQLKSNSTCFLLYHIFLMAINFGKLYSSKISSHLNAFSERQPSIFSTISHLATMRGLLNCN